MSQSKVLSLVSLATRAGKTASGEFCTEKEVKSGRAFLVLVADDASEIQRKNSKTCVNFMKFQSIFIKIKILLGMRWEKRCGHLLQSLMRGLQKES